MKKFVSSPAIVLIVIIAFSLWNCSKSCDIKLKNGTTGEIKVFTKLSGKESSATLKPGEALTVGKCIDCADISDDEIEIDQMLVSLGIDELEMKDRKEVVKFLNELTSEDCLVKIFQ